tara:strand:+ start:5169 stop:6320 length:1152 start_codon:yes stop_codon:yes gene_type:complete
MYTGPNLIKDRLAFGYDAGYGVSDNNTATRFYPGEPTTNVTPLADFIDTSNWTGGGWQGSIAVSSDYDNTLEITAYNGWRTFAINHGITTGGTVSVSFEYKLKSAETSNIFGLVLNGRNLGSYHNNLGDISNSDLKTRVWKKYNGSFTANSNSYGAELAIGLRGADNAGENNVMYIRNLQVEQKGHSTPYTQTSRSSTAGLIDLKKSASLNLSNASFDSTGQPDFDGTSDSVLVGNVGGYRDKITVESIFKTSSSTNWKNMLCGANGDIIFTVYQAKLNFGCQGNSPIPHSNYSTTNVNDGQFHHGVATYDGSSVKIYVDGVLESTNTRSGAITPSTLRAGSNSAGNSEFFNGSIPLVKLYNKALTATEIKQNFNAYKNRFNI